MSTILAVDLKEFTAAFDRYDPCRNDLALTFGALRTDARLAASSVLGLSISVTMTGQHVTFTSMATHVRRSDIASSLRVRLGALAPHIDGIAVLYSGIPDAFVELASELKQVLALRDDELQLNTDLEDADISA
jgi:hypothetical protein